MSKRETHKVFVSHHHTDAKALDKMKKALEPVGFQCFLAHVDIRPGEHDLNRIEKEIQDCDACLYVGSKLADKSHYCQQEMGMAKVLGKEIIPAMKGKRLPKGFIQRLQRMQYEAIDDGFYNTVYMRLLEICPPSLRVQKHLEALGIKGFSATQQDDMLHLDSDNWNDFGYRTLFALRLHGDQIGSAKIGYEGQRAQSPTSGKLPRFFTHISRPFFSRVAPFRGSLSPEQVKGLRYLLNDTKLMSESDQRRATSEQVYEISLRRVGTAYPEE